MPQKREASFRLLAKRSIEMVEVLDAITASCFTWASNSANTIPLIFGFSTTASTTKSTLAMSA